MLTVITSVLLASIATLIAGQVGPDATSIVQDMAQNVERTTDARRQYMYDKSALTGLWTSGLTVSRSVERHEALQYIVTGAYGQALAVDGLKGECKNSERVEPYTQPGFLCKGLGRIATADSLLINLVDENKSLNGVPYWLLPLRPEYLRFFQFELQGKEEFHGRPVFIIGFKPARATSPKLPLDDLCRFSVKWREFALR
jgi:hypothetical protein